MASAPLPLFFAISIPPVKRAWFADIPVFLGALRYIRNLKPWPLQRVMVEKYLWEPRNAQALCAFLEPMLVIDHRKRAHARDMVDHPWLEVDPLSEDLWGW